MPIGQLDPAVMIRLQQLIAQREREKQPGYPMSALSKATAISAEPPMPVQPGKTREESDQFYDQLLNMGMSGGAGVTNFASKAEREIASKAVLNGMYEWLTNAGYHPNDAVKIVNQVGQYPRVAAHLDPKIQTLRQNSNYRGVLKPPNIWTADDPTSRLALKPEPNRPMATQNAIFHELTHQAQKIGMGGPIPFEVNYGRGNASAGYHDNPMEISARDAAGARAPVRADEKLNATQALFDALFKRK